MPRVQKREGARRGTRKTLLARKLACLPPVPGPEAGYDQWLRGIWERQLAEILAWAAPPPKADRPFCGARCRDGHACRARAVPGEKRCRQHGGLSTGPTSAEGKAAIAESNRRRAAARRRAQQQRAATGGGAELGQVRPAGQTP